MRAWGGWFIPAAGDPRIVIPALSGNVAPRGRWPRVHGLCLWGSIFLCLLCAFSGCGEWGRGLPEDVVARVNEESVTAEEFNQEFQDLILEPGKEKKWINPGDLKKAYLDQMIERKILVQEARRLGIKVSLEELNQVIQEIKMDYPGEGLSDRLGLRGMSLEEWKVRLEEKLLAEKMVRVAHRHQATIDEKEAHQYYEDHRSEFELKERVKARQIVVADGEEALQILKRLKNGEKFEKLAFEKSMGPEKVNGGDLGTFSAGERPPEFDQVFFLEAGAMSEVIKSPYGYHIFKVEEKISPRQIPFEEAKTGILKDLGKRKGEEEYQKWFKGLREKAKVEINKKLLSS